jgi:hypothetical protein
MTRLRNLVFACLMLAAFSLNIGGLPLASAAADTGLPCYDMWSNCTGSADYCNGVWCGCMGALYGYMCPASLVEAARVNHASVEMSLVRSRPNPGHPREQR